MIRPVVSDEPTIAFGPFRLLPAQRLLQEGKKPVRLGSCALDLLIVLVDHPGEVVGRDELMARAWARLRQLPELSLADPAMASRIEAERPASTDA